jgi:hypothetical protein
VELRIANVISVKLNVGQNMYFNDKVLPTKKTILLLIIMTTTTCHILMVASNTETLT